MALISGSNVLSPEKIVDYFTRFYLFFSENKLFCLFLGQNLFAERGSILDVHEEDVCGRYCGGHGWNLL